MEIETIGIADLIYRKIKKRFLTVAMLRRDTNARDRCMGCRREILYGFRPY